MKTNIKVAVSYRVLQNWRKPVFDAVSSSNGVELKVFTSHGFNGTKVINYSGSENLPYWRRLYSFNLFIRRRKGNICMPLSPGLFFSLFNFKPDIIITEGASNLFNNIICFIYAKIFRVKILQWGLGEIPGVQKSFFRNIYGKLIGKYESYSDGAICYSSHSASYYNSIGLPLANILVALNVVDTNARLNQIVEFEKIISSGYYFSEPRNKIVYIGSLEPNKDVDFFLRLASDIQNRLPDLEILVIGDGPERLRLVDYSSSLALKNISFLGHVSGELASHLYEASILILPSLGGLVISEGLVHGVPVICGPADGVERDLLNHQSDFLMTNKLKDDFPNWRDAALVLLSDKCLVKKIRLDGLLFINSHGIDNYTSAIINFIKRLNNVSR